MVRFINFDQKKNKKKIGKKFYSFLMRIQIKGCGFNNENMFEAYLSYNENIVSYSRGNYR